MKEIMTLNKKELLSNKEQKEKSNSHQKLKHSFNIQIDFDKDMENVIISDEFSSGAEYECKTIEDLERALKSYLENYIEIENVKVGKMEDYDL